MNNLDQNINNTMIIAAGGTGGHIFPALSLIDKIIDLKLIIITDSRGEIFFKSFFKKNKIAFKNRNSNYCLIVQDLTSPSNKNLIKKIISLFKFLISTIKLLKLFIYKRPNIIMGFGGYPSVVPVTIGKILGIPTIIHEQNAILGRANKFLANFSNILALSFKDTKFNEKRYNSIFTGNFVRKEFYTIGKTEYVAPNNKNIFCILIMGGSLGADFLSEEIANLLCTLPIKYKKRLLVFHQVKNYDISKVNKLYIKNKIKAEVSSFFNDVFIKFKKTHLIIARSGGSSIAEIIATHIPSILIPLPTALDNHQTENAEFIANIKGGWLINQSTFNSKAFIILIQNLMTNPKKLKAANLNIKNISINNLNLLQNNSSIDFVLNIIFKLINKHPQKGIKQ